MGHPLKAILNKLMWDPRLKAEDYEIRFVHRGAPSDLKGILASQIVEVGRSWFAYRDEAYTIIPFHRILEVKNRETGEVLWRSRSRPSSVKSCLDKPTGG